MNFARIDPRIRRRAALLSLLMLASALTEGLGLVLLVPMLGALGETGLGGGSRLARALTALGVPISLEPLLAMFVALAVARAVIGHARSLAGLRVQIAIVDGLRRRAWSALLHCDWRVLSAMRQSDNASLLVSNIDRVGYGVQQALAAVSTCITLGGIGLAALAISPGIMLGATIGGALVLLAYRGMRRRAAELGEQMSEAYGRVYCQIQEGLGALRVIKSFGREQQAEEQLVEGFGALRRSEAAYIRDVGLGQIALQGGGALLLALLVWFAITQWHAQAITVLPMVALFARALPLLGALQVSWQNWAHARPALAAAQALIAEAEAGREEDFAEALAPSFQKTLVLTQVTVCFFGRLAPALDAVDLVISARGLTAITGPSGAGKSTIADLMGGLIAPDAGTIAIDSVILDGGARRAWRSRVAYVQQEPVLFSGTLRDNLLWASPQVSEARLWQALEDASALFVRDLPQGLDTPLGESGRQLSGGERQRVVLARALLRDPVLLILDEATSALDAGNEEAIVEALQRLKSRLAIVVICHRGALVNIADRVVTMECGRVVSLESFPS
jgi:ATP-binding cassette subfamily C protein